MIYLLSVVLMMIYMYAECVLANLLTVHDDVQTTVSSTGEYLENDDLWIVDLYDEHADAVCVMAVRRYWVCQPIFNNPSPA